MKYISIFEFIKKRYIAVTYSLSYNFYGIFIVFMRRLFLLLLLTSFFVTNISYSQIFSKFGFRAGFIVTGMSTYNDKPPKTNKRPNTFIYDSTSFFNNVSLDIALTSEWFNSRLYCLSAELHYLQKGEAKVEYFTPDLPIKKDSTYDAAGSLYDNAGYLSLQLLSKVKVPLSYEGDNYYFFGGPVFDYRVSDKSENTDNQYVIYPGKFEVGVAMGIGFEIVGALAFEGKYQYDITGPYDFNYKGDVVKRRYHGLAFTVNYTFINKAKLFK